MNLITRKMMMVASYSPVVAEGWNIGTAVYDSVLFSVNSEDIAPQGVFFKSDGTKMYMAGEGNNFVHQYTLTTAWDLSTASYDSVSFDVSSELSRVFNIFFKSDGTKMYAVGLTTDSVFQYTLTSAWDLSTASYDSVFHSVASEDSAPTDIFFKSDGTKMYMVGAVTDSVHQYSLTTAWDLSTASYDSVFHSVASEDNVPFAIFFKSDGTKMYISGNSSDSIYQYTLTSAWDLSTASYDSVSLSIASEDNAPYDIFFKSDGTKMYLLGAGNDSIYQYTVSA